MTEQEWLVSSDPVAMLEIVTSKRSAVMTSGTSPVLRTSNRKLRLYNCACIRQVWHLLKDKRSRRVVEVSERYADGEATQEERREALYALPSAGGGPWKPEHRIAGHCGFDDGWEQWLPLGEELHAAGLLSKEKQASLVHEIFGNPFRPFWWADDPKQHADPSPRSTPRPKDVPHVEMRRDWLTPDVLALARAAYDERPGRKCERCKGRKRIRVADEEELNRQQSRHEYPFTPPTKVIDCPDCHGAGRIENGTLCPTRLGVLADALEEAGCSEEVSFLEAPAVLCCPDCGDAGFWRTGQEFEHMRKCRNASCGTVWVPGEVVRMRVATPNPILEHLRGSGPHVRGCHMVDLFLGKE